MKNKGITITIIVIAAIFALCLFAYSTGLSNQVVMASRIFRK